MSVVVAKRRPGGGYDMAADSISVRGWTKTKPEKATKLERVGEIDIGSCGWASEHGLLVAYTLTHLPASSSSRDVVEWLAEFRKWKFERSDSKEIKNGYLLGMGGDVFDSDTLKPIDDYEAIGAGMDFALAALHLGKSAKEAVEVAIELSVMCAGPVIELRTGP